MRPRAGGARTGRASTSAVARRSAALRVRDGTTGAHRLRRNGRLVWGLCSVVAFESVVVGASIAAGIGAWRLAVRDVPATMPLRTLLLAVAAVPAYLLAAFVLMLLSAWLTRALGWRTRPDVATPVAQMEWPLIDWARYLAAIHVVRALAGPAFRSTVAWNLYLRANGARVGRGTWVNSLSLMDHNLLTLGDGVVIGSDAHVSGHIVEAGILRTAPVVIGAGATIGIGSVVEIGAAVGEGCRVGALAVVPKHARIGPGGVYVGAPAHRLPMGHTT